MTALLRRGRRDAPDGVVHRLTPADAGWHHVGFELRVLRQGERASGNEADRELCLVLVRGRARLASGGEDWGVRGHRADPFDGSPDALYVPPGTAWQVVADTEVELAICSAVASTGFGAARLIASDTIETLDRGNGTNLRHVRNILPDTAPAESLLVVEVVTPGGHWSSYPPHKHDTDDGARETYLEETYYHRLRRGAGFALQRVYTPNRSLDETMAVGDGDLVLVPRGYHPVGAPHGFDLWYLNVMAGPRREWRFTMDPDHAHLPY